MTQAEYLCPVP